jgi:MFS family permease
VRGFLRESGEGLRVIRRSAGLRRAVLAGVAVSFMSGAYLVVEPLYARHVLHRPPSQFALFEAAAGAGAVLTGLLLPRVRRQAAAALDAEGVQGSTGVRWMAAAGAGYAVAGALFTTTTIVPVAYLGAFLWGCVGATFYAFWATVIQRFSPPDATGRLFGVSGMLNSVADTVALPAAGLVVAQLGVRSGAALLAAVPLAVCLASLTPAARWRRHDRVASARTPPAASTQ